MKKICKLFSLLLCICLLLNSCSTKLVLPNRLAPEKTPALQEFDYTKFSHKQLLEEIKALNKILSEKNISESKYEDILNRLEHLGKQLKMFEAIKFNRKEASFTIPANSKTTLEFKSYCLNPHGGSPASKEQFTLRKTSPDIPLYKDIMTFTNSGQKTLPVNKQLLLWNLKNNVKFESFPLEQQTFLMKMDPKSLLKVNNLIKSEVKSQLKKYVQQKAPLYNEVSSAVSLVKGKAHTYEDYARNIEKMAIKAKLIDNIAPIKADGYDIFTQTASSGFNGTTIIFVNINVFPIAIACTAFLDPFRKGVQPIGFDFPKLFEEHEKYEDEILSELDKLIITLSKLGILKFNAGDQKSIKDNLDNKLAVAFFCINTASAYFSIKMLFGGTPSHDEGDAVRHAYWSAILTRDLGVVKAEEFLTNHELPPNQEKGREMDLHNNRIGREIGAELSKQGKYLAKDYMEAVFANKDRLQVDEPKGNWGREWLKY